MNHSMLTSVSISENGDPTPPMRWTYNYASDGSLLLTKWTNGRGDYTDLFWGPTGPNPDTGRGSRFVSESDNLVYDDMRINWNTVTEFSGDLLVNTTVSTLADRVSQRRKVQTQKYNTLYDELRGIKSRRLVEVAGPGCASCGMGEEAKFFYGNNGTPGLAKDVHRLVAQCNADGIEEKLTYDYAGNVIRRDTLGSTQSTKCIRKPHIISLGGSDPGNENPDRVSFTEPFFPGVPSKVQKWSIVTGNLITNKFIATYIDYPFNANVDCIDPTRYFYMNDNPNVCWATKVPQEIVETGFTTGVYGALLGPIGQGVQSKKTYSYYFEGAMLVEDVSGPRAGNRVLRKFSGPLLASTHVYSGTGYLVTTIGSYDAFGNPTTVIDPSGALTTYEYNNWNKVSKTTQSDGVTQIVTTYIYDDAGSLSKLILPEGNVVEYTYTGYSYPKKISRRNFDGGPVIDYVEYDYDPEGNRTAERAYLGSGVKKFEAVTKFDDYNNVAGYVNGNGNEEVLAYSASGLLISKQGADGNQKQYFYDALRRLREVRSPDGGKVTYGYDPNGNLFRVVSLKNAGGATTTLTYYYDDFGRLRQTTSPDTGLTMFEYDVAGNLVARNDSLGTVRFTYDAANRIIQTLFESTGETAVVTWDSAEGSLNAMGRVAKVVSGDASATFKYDLLGRVTSELRTLAYVEAGEQQFLTAETGRAYDRNGNLRELRYPSGVTVYYDPHLDDLDRVGTVRAWTLKEEKILASSISYDPGNLLAQVSFGNEYVTRWQRDNSRRLTGLTSDRPTKTLVNRAYGYSQSGNIESIVDAVNGSQAFDYDPQDRLTFASGGWGNDTYTYDYLGNRTSATRNGAAEDYFYKTGANQLQSVQERASMLVASLSTTALMVGDGQEIDADSGERNAALKRILVQLTDLAFSSRRYIRQNYGVGSFSNGTPTGAEKKNATASLPEDLWIKKLADTMIILNESLTSGLLTESDIQAAVDADTKLQEQVDLFVDDLAELPTTDATALTDSLTAMFTEEEVSLLATLLDLADIIGTPPEPPVCSLPPGFVFPEGCTLPPDFVLTPDLELPPSCQLPPDFVLPDSCSLPPELSLPPGCVLPPDFVLTLEFLISLLSGNSQLPPGCGLPEIPFLSATSESSSTQVIALSNAPSPTQDAWHGLIDDSRALLGISPRMRSGALSLSLALPGEPVSKRERIESLKRNAKSLRSQGTRASQVLKQVMANPRAQQVVMKLIGSRLANPTGAKIDAQSTLSSFGISSLALQADEWLNLGYDLVGNVTAWDGSATQLQYTYGAGGRLVAAGSAVFGYDYLGRRIASRKPSTFSDANLVSTENSFWTYGQGSEMLEWSRRNLVDADNSKGETVTESYVYLDGERIAKIVSTRAPATGGGGEEPPSCCCASTALAYNGETGQCDPKSYMAVQRLRGFRSQVLSGTWSGEKIIRFYYRDFSPVAVAVLREYPELRTVGRWILQGVAWGTSFWISPAYAATPIDTLPPTVVVYYYHNDHLGVPLALSDQSGNAAAEWVRDPFGNVISKTGTVTDNHMFPGQFWDEDAKLAYNWFRWYSPETGRYGQSDPIVQKILAMSRTPGIKSRFLETYTKNNQMFSAYAYANLNPIAFYDPYGLMSVSDCKKVIDSTSSVEDNWVYDDFYAAKCNTTVFSVKDNCKCKTSSISRYVEYWLERVCEYGPNQDWWDPELHGPAVRDRVDRQRYSIICDCE